MNSLLDVLSRRVPGMEITENEPMSDHTTFRIGGPARYFAQPSSAEEAVCALEAARECGVEAVIVGNGSNLLVRDGGIDGLVVLLGERFSNITVDGNRVIAQAGASLAKTAACAQRAGLAGLEFASGIPGTVGGGTAMNAGAYGGQLSDVLVSAKVLENGEILELSRGELEMGYRTTRILNRGGIVLETCFELREDEPGAISERMRELNRRRREKQPLEMPSAGSTFKRPEGYFAGALIEGAGLKGLRSGNAVVSEKHAGFLVNLGGATAADVLDLIGMVQRAVMEKYGVALEPEVRILGVD